MIDIDKELSVIRQYLLNRLDEEGRQRFEERFVTDPAFREAALVVEDELIEDYLIGLLTGDEREDFVGHYLSAPRQLEELKLSQALREYATREVEAEGGALDAAPVVTTRGRQKIINLLLGKNRLPALALALLLLIALVVGWSLAGGWRWGNRQAALNAEVALLNNQSSGGGSTQEVPLTSVLNRAPQQGQKVAVADGVTIVRLLLNLHGRRYQRYEATLRVYDGPEVFTVGSLDAEDTDGGQLLKLKIPARLLTPEDYVLSVRGSDAPGQAEEIAEYFFRVVK
jgi:hypothetical protein